MIENLGKIEDLNKQKTYVESGMLRLQMKIDNQEADLKTNSEKAAECVRMCQETEERIILNDEIIQKLTEQSDQLAEEITA